MEQQQKGRALYVVLALVFAGLIVGGASWAYIKGDKASNETTSKTAPTETAAVSAETASTELSTGLSELETELAAIEVDEESDDDSIDY